MSSQSLDTSSVAAREPEQPSPPSPPRGPLSFGAISAVSGVALPNEVPPPPNLEQIPPRILHSATVETLLSHNDDLTSRLKVHIRRNGQLEGRLLELELELEESELARQTLGAQIEILREKDRAFAERGTLTEARISKLKDDLDLAKTEVTEIQRRNRDLLLRESRAWSYRRRVQRWVQPGIVARVRQIELLESQLEAHRQESERVNAALTVLRQELQHSRAEADRKISGFERDRARLVDQYETQVQSLKTELKSTQGELTKVTERAATLDRVTSESAKTSNERVFFERRADELESQLKSETTRLRGAVDDLAKECSTLRASNETIRKLKESSDQAAQMADESRSKAESQLQSLREIWKETSLKAQALELKNDSLERLNAELSRKLQESREIRRTQPTDDGLNKVGFIEDGTHNEKLKRLDLILTDLEMKAFGIRPHDSTQRTIVPSLDSDSNTKAERDLDTLP